MLFNTFEFIVFFTIVFILNYTIPSRFRWLLTLISGLSFYCFSNPVYIFVPLVILLLTLFGAKIISLGYSHQLKKISWISIIFLLAGSLVFFKYSGFLIANVNKALAFINSSPGFKVPSIIAPLGISYLTFQAIGYIIDIKRGSIVEPYGIKQLSTFIFFFPKLIAGPVERIQNFANQITIPYAFNSSNVTDGFRQILWGFFKKVVIADRIALITGQIFDFPDQHNGIALTVGSLLFTVQLYADFSGYTDIALGTARVLGIELMKNFNLPFSSTNITEFWRRWHISLSSWFNEYVYAPMSINLRNWGTWSIIISSTVTFTILGLWHGPSWNFVIFGLFQGIALSLEFVTRKMRKKTAKKMKNWIPAGIGVIYTFCFFSFTLIFFKASTFNDAVYIISHLADLNGLLDGIGIPKRALISAILYSAVVIGAEWIVRHKKNVLELDFLPGFARWFVYYVVIFLILSNFNGKQDFIYYQF